MVSETQDFSFAYLKELFVTSMVQWLSSGGAVPMDEVLIGQTELLRSQMNIQRGIKLVAHRVDDHVDADFVGG